MLALLDVRLMLATDAEATATVFQEMQAHYRVACPSFAEIVAKLSGLPVGIFMLVAAEPTIVGFAALCTIFPGPGLSPGLFLKELFVSAQARGRGIGTKLMHSAAHLAVERGFARLDWTADRADPGLLRFYAGLGAAEQSEKVFFRLSGQALADLASSSSGGQTG
jgi:GNAT superfamily N-acetyltransferase